MQVHEYRHTGQCLSVHYRCARCPYPGVVQAPPPAAGTSGSSPSCTGSSMLLICSAEPNTHLRLLCPLLVAPLPQRQT